MREGIQEHKENISSKENGEEKLLKFFGEIVERLREEKIPVNDDGRINMEAYSLVHGFTEIQKDQEYLRDKKEIWNSQKEGNGLRDGEKFEILKTVLFSKFLGGDFIIARSSEFDDVNRGVDNLILEKATGNLVCAFDEVVDIPEQDKERRDKEIKDRYEEKKKRIKDQNIEWGGGKIKYGIGMKEGGVILKEYESTPVFYLKVLKKDLYKNLDKLIPSFDERSPEETELFSSLIDSLDEQYHELKENEDKLRPYIKESLAKFGKVLKSIKKNRRREEFLAGQ